MTSGCIVDIVRLKLLHFIRKPTTMSFLFFVKIVPVQILISSKRRFTTENPHNTSCFINPLLGSTTLRSCLKGEDTGKTDVQI